MNGHAKTKTMAKTVMRRCQNSCQWLGIVSKEAVVVLRREIDEQELSL